MFRGPFPERQKLQSRLGLLRRLLPMQVPDELILSFLLCVIARKPLLLIALADFQLPELRLQIELVNLALLAPLISADLQICLWYGRSCHLA